MPSYYLEKKILQETDQKPRSTKQMDVKLLYFPTGQLSKISVCEKILAFSSQSCAQLLNEKFVPSF